MPQRGIQFHIVTNQSVQQVFQSTGSIRVLNPNDGVCYVALDRKATFTDWDHKLPSQSYGQLPGPLNNYISIFYLDQSGTGSAGDVVLYQSAEQIDIPVFLAIGRAIQSQVTTLDIIQGTQPGNPPAGVTRLWSDTNGNVYHLSSTGVNAEFLDTNNYTSIVGGMALGGDLYGSINAGHIGLVYGSAIRAYDSGGTLRSLLDDTSTNITRIWSLGSGFQFVGTGGGQLVYIDGSGNTSVNDLSATRYIYGGANLCSNTGDISANRGNGTGVIFLGTTSTYLFYDGGTYQLPGHPINVGGGATFNGNVSLGSNQWVFFGPGNTNGIISDNTSLYIRTNGTCYIQNTSGSPQNLTCSAISSGAITATGNIQGPNLIATNSVSSQGAVDAVQWIRAGNSAAAGSVYFGNTGARIDMDSSNVVFRGPNGGGNQLFQHLDGTWMGTQAANFQVQSSVDHAELYGQVISSIDDSVGKVMALDPVYYYHLDGVIAGTDTLISEDGHYTYGFSAKQVASILPELVDSAAGMIDYNRMMAVLWQAVKEIVGSLPPGMVPMKGN